MKLKFTPPPVLRLKTLSFFCCAFIMLLADASYGQVPAFSYNSPKTYTTGAAITPLAPKNTGGTVSPLLVNVLAGGISRPINIALDRAENVYTSDESGKVLKIPAGGGAPIVIGSGFFYIPGLAADTAGNVYIVDYYNGKIKKIPANGDSIIDVGPTFTRPYGITLDGSENILISDKDGIKKMPVNGGDPVLIVSSPKDPIYLISLDKHDNLYYSDGRRLYEKLAGGGPANLIAYEPDTGINGFAVQDDGTVYYSTERSYLTKIMPASGEKQRIGAGLSSPVGLALDTTGRIYTSCFGSNTISRVTVGGYFINSGLPLGLNFDPYTGIISGQPTVPWPSTNYTITALNSSGSASTMVNLSVTPMSKPSITYSNFNVYKKNYGIDPLAPINTGGSISAKAPATVASGVYFPSGITVDASETIYFGTRHGFQSWISKFNPSGSGWEGGQAFDVPNQIAGYLAVDGSGNIFVVNGGAPGFQIVEIPADGGATVSIVKGYTCHGLAVDNVGNIYICGDYGLMKYPPKGGGKFTVLAAIYTYGLTLDRAGNLYTTDIHNSLIEVKALTNTVVTLATLGAKTGIGVSAADAWGNVYFTTYNSDGSKSLCRYDATTGHIITIVTGIAQGSGLAADANGNVFYPNYTGDSDGNGQIGITEITTSGYYLDKPLPAGLVFNNATGVISGAPTVSSPANTYTVTAINNGGSSSSSFSLSVLAGPLANSSLSGLIPNVSHLRSPFTAKTFNYSVIVANPVSTIAFTPTAADSLATITVNGVAVTSGMASAAIPLTTGQNKVQVVVTATDGSKTTYLVTVNRLKSSNAFMATLLLSNGILSPKFSHLTNNYTAQVGPYVESMTVVATTLDTTATVTVNGSAVALDATSAAIPLTVGINLVTIAVTAEDGTVNTYSVNVTRVPSENAYLMGLKLNRGYDVPLFSHLIFNYATTVRNAIATVDITPISSVPSSTITVNGLPVVSGTTSADIPLAVGINIISTVVTAQDGVTQNTYTVTVTRAPASTATEPTSLNTVYQPVGIASTSGIDGLASDDIMVHSGVSPNGDGVNDFLQIENIGKYPENKLQIMTRNGQLIFEAKNYDNSNKVFDGHSNKTGQLQLPGTYFYSLYYVQNGEVKHKTGFILLKY